MTETAERVCPFSDETLTGCPHYVPVSEHGDFPDAGSCLYAEAVRVGEHVLEKRCTRRRTPPVRPTYDQL